MKMDLPVKMKGMFVKLMMMIMAIQRAAPAKPCHKIMNNALYNLTYSIANVMMLETEQIWKNFPVNEKKKHQGAGIASNTWYTAGIHVAACMYYLLGPEVVDDELKGRGMQKKGRVSKRIRK